MNAHVNPSQSVPDSILDQRQTVRALCRPGRDTGGSSISSIGPRRMSRHIEPSHMFHRPFLLPKSLDIRPALPAAAGRGWSSGVASS